jgi:ABC-2 type transport system permease protein
MFTRLVRLELLNLWRAPRLAAAMAIFAAVLLLSGIVSWRRMVHDNRIKASVAAEERQRWLGQGDKDPHSAAHYSVYAFRPSPALAAIDPGILPFVGEAVWLEAHLQNDLLFRPQQDVPLFERIGLLDPAGLLIRIGPLLIFLLAFNAAAREREHGLLALALSTTTAPHPYLGAKATAVAFAAAATLVVPVALAGTLAIHSATDSVDGVARLAGWIVAALIYITILSAIAVSVAIAVRSAQAAFATLFAVWVALVLAPLPTASAAATWLSPLPSFQQMKLRLAEDAPAYWTPETGTEQVAAILERYGAAREEDLQRTINIRGAQLDEAERHAQAVFDREIGGFYDRVQLHDNTYARLGWLSPAVAFDVASSAFAGTDFFHHRHFVDGAERYRRALVNRMNADLIPHPAVNGRDHTADIRLWSQIPAFDYQPRAVSSAIQSAMPASLGLVCWLFGGAVLVAGTAARLRP